MKTQKENITVVATSPSSSSVCSTRGDVRLEIIIWWLSVVIMMIYFHSYCSLLESEFEGKVRVYNFRNRKTVKTLSQEWTLHNRTHLWKPRVQKNCKNATYAALSLFRPLLWGYIWKFTLDKKHSNATNATMHLFGMAIWKHTWEVTPEKNPTNATNATMHLSRKAIWEDIWKVTPEKNLTNATNATIHLFGQAI